MTSDASEQPTLSRRWYPVAARVVDLSLVRRSMFVGTMKVILPIAALVVVGLLAIWPQLYRPGDEFRLDFARLSIDAGGPTMANARYRGTDRQNRPFQITAENASPDPVDRQRTLLHNLSADYVLDGGSWIFMSADAGLFREEAKLLSLSGDIALYSDQGYEFHGVTAEIDFNAGSVASDDKVWGQGPLGLLRANGLRIYDNGGRIQFIKGVHTTLFPQRRS